MNPYSSDREKLQQFNRALDLFVDRVREDRYVLAVILVGSLDESTIWDREGIGLWVIEADGVTRRLQSDGNDERIFRILVEEGINLHMEVIPRSRFKKMVEGASRTAFSCSYFAKREVVYSADPSIEQWFEQANTIATKDREKELLAFTTWTIHAVRHARLRLEKKQDLDLVFQQTIWAAHSVSHTEIIRHGEIWEDDVIYRAIELQPELFQVIYTDVLSQRKNKKTIVAALDRIDEYLDEHWQSHLRPLLSYLRKENRTVPLSEISEYFAYSQLYPWHFESACEWLEEKGRLEKLSAPFQLTKRSIEEVEEPAYFMDED